MGSCRTHPVSQPVWLLLLALALSWIAALRGDSSAASHELRGCVRAQPADLPGTAPPALTRAQPPYAAEQQEPQADAPRLVQPGVYRIGLVTLDQTNRTVRFPAAVNQRAGLVEYAVVTTRGKVHESIFRTEAEPRHIHLAMLLLGVKPANTNRLPEDPASPLPGESIQIEVAWKKGRKEVRRPLTEFIKLSTPARTNQTRDWRYNGSFLVEGAFAAQLGGSLIALITDPSALVNNAWADRADDEVHQVRGEALPREDASAEIVLRVAQASEPRLGPYGGPPAPF